MSTVHDCSIVPLKRIEDSRGNLTFIEGGVHIPFEMQRAYWIYDVPGGEQRGGHAYRTLHEFIIALSGSFDVLLRDGDGDRVVSLNRSYRGLLVPPGIWRELHNFSTNSVALVLASAPYDESDYFRDYDAYVQFRRDTNDGR
jgi:dTDP-4-dehydrorhamnose 3,5-epimerase-like enzyme